MANYTVHGPFMVPLEKLRGGRHINKKALPEFWEECNGVAESRGCYVFGFRGRGFTPVYVGKATKTFRQECFGAHQLSKHYNPAILDRLRGTPVLFLIAQKTGRGRSNVAEIGEIEKFLIQVAVAKNPGLSNVHHTKKDGWSIDGVIRAKQGSNSHASRDFKNMMGL